MLRKLKMALKRYILTSPDRDETEITQTQGTRYKAHCAHAKGRDIDQALPESKVHGAIMGPIWGRQDPEGPHVGPMNFAIWAGYSYKRLEIRGCLCKQFNTIFVWHAYPSAVYGLQCT